MSKEGKEESHSLARSCLGYANDVSSRHNGRYGLRLDGGRSGIIELLDNVEAII